MQESYVPTSSSVVFAVFSGKCGQKREICQWR